MNLQRIVSSLLAALLLTLAGASSSLAATPREPATPAREARDLIPPDPVAELRLAGGSELIFYQLTADDGTARAIGVAGYVPARGVDPNSVRELHGANPHELFYALSGRGTDVPALLREHHPNRFDTRPQGWALDRIKPQIFKNLFSCALTESLVANAVAATGLPHSYNELSKGPHNWPLWAVEDPNALFPSYKNTLGVTTSGDAYYHVMLCDLDTNNLYPAIDVSLSYTESNANGVLSAGQLDWQLTHIGDQMSFMSWPFDSDLAGTNTWFWFMSINNVYHSDTLHIGTAWS